MHPFETLFVKSSWHVGEPFLTAYSRWGARLAASSSSSSSLSGAGAAAAAADDDGGGEDENFAFDAGTKGQFDGPRYRYAISPEAQGDWGVSACFGKGAPDPPEWRRSQANDGGGGWRTWWQT